MTGTALSLLTPGEICSLVLNNGQRREGAWNPNLLGFYFCDEKTNGIAFLPDIVEWWPASAKF
jgi:hypothetical protein